MHSQSVRYLTGLPEAVSVPISDLAQSFGQFIGAVLSRLGATTKSNSELLELWNAIRNESENPSFQTERIFEAQLGFDADECPEELLQTALELSEEIGGDTLSEISPIYGRVGFGKFRDLCDSIGLMAHPDLSPLSLSFDDTTSHVSRAHSLSKWLRSELNIGERPVEDLNSLIC
ncbi:MAG: hypothetical protein IPK58_06670 [Acidobacteria bacterium]|nr:hypothetical protein [Acidobacteriota bacterium]